MNKITGEKTVNLCGKTYVMRFTWAALAEIEQKYGDTPNLFSPEVVASIAAIGLRGKHPEMTAQKIMEISPPLVPLSKDVQVALQWAYFGPESVPGTVGDVKKNRLRGGLLQGIARLFRRG